MNNIPTPKIKIRNLSVLFSKQMVLSDVSLDIYPGQINVAVGSSGSGKTTFLRSLNRLNDFFSNCEIKGNVWIDLEKSEVDCYNSGYPASRLRQKVGMVFQHPNLLPFSIHKNLALPLRLTLGLSKKNIEDRVQWSLQEVGLWEEVKDRLNKSALDLSGGQQQRLCLARVISLKPEVILLDEPSASLDFKSTARIEEMIFRLKDQYTIVAVTHSLSQMERLADRIFVFNSGRIATVIDDFDSENSKKYLELIQNNF